MMEWVQWSVALSTWNSYIRVWREWCQLEIHMGFLFLHRTIPLMAWQLAMDFCNNLLVSVVGSFSISIYVPGLARFQFTKDFVIRQTVKGFKKSKRSRDIRRPITFNVLDGLHARLVETAHSPFKHKAGVGSLVELHGVEGFAACPVKCFNDYCRVRPDHQGSCLMPQDCSALSRFQFITVLKKTLQGLILASVEYGSHSFKIGAAMDIARWGLGEEFIRRIGRWNQTSIRPCKVWLLGFSFIHWAERQATVHHADSQLGFQEAQVKLKGNELGQCPMKLLIKNIRKDCLRLWSLFPGITIIWSEIIPRAHWGAHSQAVNKARVKTNKVVSKFVQTNGGVLVRHRELEYNNAFFLPDRVHINDIVLDLFNCNLLKAITMAWKVWWRMRS
ncbi:hypothetical protein XELAEV_18002071mg [Xenopus laevis]|nr:hypothetical protein XELAEV_18002071mg [Xenopus laevis]